SQQCWQRALEMMAKRSFSSRHSGVLAVLTLASALAALGSLIHLSETEGWSILKALRGPTPAAGRGESDGGELGPILNLPNVTVRLRGADRDVYVDVAFDLEVGSERDKDAAQGRMSGLQEATIKVLSESTPDDMRGPRRLERTKARLLEHFRSVVSGRKLKALYVSYLMMG
ncbi:MAG TPA: flagellar basal body-associated FliL family protein, partial [Polyangia bacterium]